MKMIIRKPPFRAALDQNTTSPKLVPELNNSKEVMEFLKESTLHLSEFITGVLVTEKTDWKLSAGHLVQAVIKGNLFTQLGREFEKYRSTGEIKEDIFATDHNRMTLYELLKSIDEDVPDEIRFKALKSIFIRSVKKDATAEDEELGYEFLKTARKLSSTEILILKANFEIANNSAKPGVSVGNLSGSFTSRDAWLINIAKQLGYEKYPTMIGKYEDNLIAQGLISQKTHADNSGFRPTDHFRLTNLGYDFCKFITEYE